MASWLLFMIAATPFTVVFATLRRDMSVARDRVLGDARRVDPSRVLADHDEPLHGAAFWRWAGALGAGDVADPALLASAHAYQAVVRRQRFAAGAFAVLVCALLTNAVLRG